MSNKAKFSWVFISALAFCTLVFFNNCQPAPFEAAGPSTPPGTNGGPNPGPGPGGGSTNTTPQNYFENSLRPLLGQQSLAVPGGKNCISCHGPGGPVAALDELVQSYTYMKSKIADITSATDNVLYTTFTGGGKHVAANYGTACSGDINGSVSPCTELINWLLLEKPTLTLSGVFGNLDDVGIFGQIAGYAIDGANRNAAAQVHVYDGPVNVGDLTQNRIGIYTANGVGSGATDGHRFSFTLPDAYRDGLPSNIHIYVGTPSANTILPSTPRIATAYVYSAAKETFFNNNIRNSFRVAACMTCHDFNYQFSFSALVRGPSPANNGSATNNYFRNYPDTAQHTDIGASSSASQKMYAEAFWRCQIQNLNTTIGDVTLACPPP